MIMPLDSAIYIGGYGHTRLFSFAKKVAQPGLVEYAFNKEGQLADRRRAQAQLVPKSIVHVERELFFGAAELFRGRWARYEANLKIIRAQNAQCAQHGRYRRRVAPGKLVRYMNEKEATSSSSEAKSDLIRVLKNSGLYEYIEGRNIFTDDPYWPTCRLHGPQGALRNTSATPKPRSPSTSVHSGTNRNSETPPADAKIVLRHAG